jgi:hypothetical protein
MYVLLIILLVTGIRAQYLNQCACSCCLGQSCPAVVVGMVNVQNCSADICLAQCRCTYPQCAANPPYGQLLTQCTNPVNAFTCQCLCCNTGSSACTPTFVGYATVYQYQCQISACSIACAAQYPAQCVANANGQTQATCLGLVTTTTAMTTIAPWLGNICSCLYCQSGYTCTSNLLVGVTSVSQCSSSDCTSACQNRYPITCSTSYLSQISGVCLVTANAKTRCKCNCCGTYGCVDYDLTINDTCTSCYSRCAQVSPCMNSRPPTYTCTANQPKITADFLLSVFILILLFVVNLFN